MEIKRANEVKIDELVAAFTAGFSDYIVPIDTSREKFIAHIHYNDIDLARSFAAIDDGNTVGLTLSAIRGKMAWIGGMAVIPEHRGEGISKQLIEKQLQDLKEAGIEVVLLEVIDGNDKARELYIKTGFRDVRKLHCLAAESIVRPKDAGLLDSHDIQLVDWKDIRPIYDNDACWQFEPSSLEKMSGLLCFKNENGYGVFTHNGQTLGIISIKTSNHPASFMLKALEQGPVKNILANNVHDIKQIRQLKAIGFKEVLFQHEMELKL